MTCCVMIGAVFTASVVSMAGLVLALLSLTILGLVFSRKNLIARILTFSVFVLVVGAAEIWWWSLGEPNSATHLAVRQLNGGNAEANQLRAFDAGNNAVQFLAAMVLVFAALGCFGNYLQPALGRLSQRFSRTLTVIGGLLVLSLLTGCMKSYDRPEYVEIDTSETGFLIGLEGDGSQQARFQSEDYLKQRKVAAKRVQILHRWSQEGRMVNEGRWIPTVRLVKVNRSPVTREWMSSQSNSGGQAHAPAGNDRAIWIESADSVGFSMGFTCTAFISEDDAAKFLYWYPSGSLSGVMDQEVRGRIQQVGGRGGRRVSVGCLALEKAGDRRRGEAGRHKLLHGARGDGDDGRNVRWHDV